MVEVGVPDVGLTFSRGPTLENGSRPHRHADHLVADEGHGVVGLQLEELRPPLRLVRGT